MAKRLKVIQNGIENFKADFKTDAEADEWLARKIVGNNFGKPERWIKDIDISKDEIASAIDSRGYIVTKGREEHEIVDEETGEIITIPAIEDIIGNEYLLPAQYEIVEIDLSVDQEYLLQQCHEKRRREYPPISEFADAFVKHMNGDSTQLEEYASKCLEIKQKHPKP